LGLTISVAMCTFNGSRFLPQQLQSIAAQNRPPDELVVCDDGSSDSSDDITNEFARHVSFRVRCLKNPANLGSTKSFSRAISSCAGVVIALADQDDVWYPHKLQRMENAFLEPSSPVAVFSDADLIDGESKPLPARLWESFAFAPREQKRFAKGEALNILVKHPVVTGATMAFRKEFSDLVLPIPANHIHDSWISFLLGACGPFLPIAEPLMQYRRHQSQQVGPGTMSLIERLGRARATGPRFYLDEIERFHQISERLVRRRAKFPYAERALREINQKMLHREHRAFLPHAGVARIPRVIREMLNGGYWRYSEGWESIAKDLAGPIANRKRLEEATR
jgi:glycosyltransferase involved in cell wall biosynthesis